MTYRPNEPHNDLPLLPPRGVETVPVYKQCVRASRALAELKGAGALIPNQAILINAIPLQEALLSSEIENIVTTQDALYRAALDERPATDPATREVLRYRTALRQGSDAVAARPIDVDMIHEIATTILDRGAVLRDQEPILLADDSAGVAVYTPPRGRARILELLHNLERFLRDDADLDPLVKMAVAHYQFEAIHPFVDGNGRTGRILNILYLLQAGLLEIPVLYLSRTIIQNKPEYYRRLRAVTENGDWESWLLFMLTAVEETALWTTGRIHAIRELIDETVEKCRAEAPRAYSMELVELIFAQPYCRISDVIDAGLGSRNTASRNLRDLAWLGILNAEQHGRDLIYKNPALLAILRGTDQA